MRMQSAADCLANLYECQQGHANADHPTPLFQGKRYDAQQLAQAGDQEGDGDSSKAHQYRLDQRFVRAQLVHLIKRQAHAAVGKDVHDGIDGKAGKHDALPFNRVIVRLEVVPE